jgi:hypothetical protein
LSFETKKESQTYSQSTIVFNKREYSQYFSLEFYNIENQVFKNSKKLKTAVKYRDFIIEKK